MVYDKTWSRDLEYRKGATFSHTIFGGFTCSERMFDETVGGNIEGHGDKSREARG